MGLQTVWNRVFPSGTLNRDLKLICVSNFIGAFGDGLFVYVLPLYIRGLQATAADVGLLFSILSLSTALTIVPGGILADRFDRKKVMILGWLLWIPVPLMISSASHWTLLAVPMLLNGAFLSGPATNAYIATFATKERMTLTFAATSASWSLGYIFSPAVGGYLADIIGMRLVFFIAFIFYSVATMLIFFIGSQRAKKPETTLQSRSGNDSFKARKLVMLSLVFAAAIFLVALVRPLVVQFMQDEFRLNEFYIGFLGSLTFLGWSVFAVGLGRIGDKWSKMMATATSLLVSSISFWLLVSFNNILSLSIASFLNGASYPIWYLMNATVGPIAPEASRGRWISLSQLTVTLAAFAAPYIGGILYETSTYAPFYLVIAATPLLAVVALLTAVKET